MTHATAEPASTPAEAGQSAQPLLGLILSAERRLRAHLDVALTPHGLTSPEWLVLYHVWKGGPLSSAELARRVYVTPQAVGQIISELETRGLVERHPDPAHGRKRLAQPTAAGRELAQKCFESLRSVEDYFLTPLTPRERPYFIELLAACVQHVST